MFLNISVALLLLLIAEEIVIAEEHWGYTNKEDELDPSHWYLKYKTCIGSRQSPIDIEPAYIEYDPALKPLIFDGYDEPVGIAGMINDGHTVRIEFPVGTKAELRSESWNTSYRLKQFHFHWSHNDQAGSEHVLFKQHYPLEMHLVHVDESVSYDEALKESFGLVVVSVLFKIGQQTEEMVKLTSHFREIADPEIRNTIILRNLNLRKLLPSNTLNYLQYAGSLTTPPCNEAVKWIILTHSTSLTHGQMMAFRSLKHEILSNGIVDEEPLEDNDRTIQGIKDRKVYLHYTFDDFDSN